MNDDAGQIAKRLIEDEDDEVDPKEFAGETFTPALFLVRLLQKLESDYNVYNNPDIKYVNNYFARYKKRIPDLEDAASNWQDLDDLIEEYGEWVLQFADQYYFDASDTQRGIRDKYRGKFRSAADYAQNYAENMGEIPDWIASYIDWEKMGTDLLRDYQTYDDGGMIVVIDAN